MIRRDKTWLNVIRVPQKWAKGGQKVGSGQLCNPFFKTGQLCKRKIERRIPFSHKFASSHRHINVVEFCILLVFIPEFDFSAQNINVKK